VPSPPFTILCIPFAGAGAGIFRPWVKYPAQSATFVPVQLPGREERFLEEPCVTMAQVVAECWAQAQPIAGAGQYALFGHSFGAIVAYETARFLAQNADRLPTQLIVSGAAAPSIQRAELGLCGLPDDQFIARLADLVGYEHEALRDPELRELLLPALRSDLAVTDGYAGPAGAAPLPVPIHALRGADDTLVSAAEMTPWASATSREFVYTEMAGDHMYFAEDWIPLAAQLDQIAQDASSPETREFRHERA
jgi:surfactin synthase thioesterase subunit